MITYATFALSIAISKPTKDFDQYLAIQFITNDSNIRNPLFPIIVHILSENGFEIPKEVQKHKFAQIARSTLIEHSLQELISLAALNNITVIPYKGQELAKLHPYPDLRVQADIDVAIANEDAEKLHNILLQNSFKPSWTGHYHSVYNKNSLHYELHTRLISYKYELFFDLGRFGEIQGKEQLISLSNEDYLLLSCLQVFDDMNRTIPFLDMFAIISKGINSQKWKSLVDSTDSAFLLHFCNERMIIRYGNAPLSELYLPKLSSFALKRIRKAAKHAKCPRDTYWALFFSIRNPIRKMLRTIFPPKDIIESYQDGSYTPHLRHIRRVFKQLSGMKNRPEGQRRF
ncbi:MAG: nucleotidyltransferase family protein [Fibrobacteres bacterium]|nr:nucleotidyltransferase family protein [Fibrobacterota bacterium]